MLDSPATGGALCSLQPGAGNVPVNWLVPAQFHSRLQRISKQAHAAAQLAGIVIVKVVHC